ncbi:MAG: 4-alpha-glucanotransferase, partial [Ardenticatenaceae bacterium]
NAPDALREKRQEVWRRPLEPVAVAWDGGPLNLKVRLPDHLADALLIGEVTLEDGARARYEWIGRDLPAAEAHEVEGRRYVVKQLNFPDLIPFGYQSFELEVSGRSSETLIISAPEKAFSPAMNRQQKTWGVFLPLYALHTRDSWGSGSFTDMESLIEWAASLGGEVVATLPLLAAFLDETPFEYSPYSPASRLLWNDFYIDIGRVPELASCREAQAVIASSELQEELASLKKSPSVDYKRQMTLKRRALEAMSRYLQGSRRAAELRRFLSDNPVVEDYARFRAAVEKQGKPWPKWDAPLRDGALKPGDYDEDAFSYHTYAQWIAREQMDALAQKANERGSGLYLDTPLGVHSDSYDVWRNQELFIRGTRVGAPPDSFFTRGQDWGFPPIHPQRLRERGYKHFIDIFRHHLSHAGI